VCALLSMCLLKRNHIYMTVSDPCRVSEFDRPRPGILESCLKIWEEEPCFGINGEPVSSASARYGRSRVSLAHYYSTEFFSSRCTSYDADPGTNSDAGFAI